jgi:TM2 domain-containing membrane protein YozV
MDKEETQYKEDIYPEPPVKSNLISDVNVWKHADRNYFVFIVLSVLFGFFGLDHFYLRSFHTGFAKLISNFTMFGFWYFWDLIQIFSEKKNIQTKGLNSPFDFVRGIGRGTFDFEKSGKYESKRSFFIYGILVLFFGLFGLDKFYIGSYGQGFTKLIVNFTPFLFLFGWLWIFYDSYVFLVKPSSILSTGLETPLPFSWFFTEPTKVNDKFEVLPVSTEQKDESWFSFSAIFAPFIGFIKSMISFIPWQPLYESLVVPVIRPPVQSAIATGTKAYTVGKAGIDLSTKLVNEGKDAISSTVGQIEQFSDPSRVQQMIQEQVQQKAQEQSNRLTSSLSQMTQPSQPQQPAVQSGGGQSSINPILAGSLTAILLAGSLKALTTYIN